MISKVTLITRRRVIRIETVFILIEELMDRGQINSDQTSFSSESLPGSRDGDTEPLDEETSSPSSFLRTSPGAEKDRTCSCWNFVLLSNSV